MRNYEIMLLFSGDLTDVETTKAMESFKSEVAKNKGKVTFEDVWGRRELAYPIKKEMEGSYVVYRFDYDPAGLVELEMNLKLNKKVLRHLISLPVMSEAEIKYAEDIELERKNRLEKKQAKAKAEKEKEKADEEKFKIKSERQEKKMIRKIEETIQEEKTETPTPSVNQKDEKFEEKLSKIIDADLDL